MSLTYPKKPCSECPWRRDVPVGRFDPDRYKSLASTAQDMSCILFSCHKSVEGKDAVCAGFILRTVHNLTLRIAHSRGDIKKDSVSDGGYSLFDTFRDMAVANGVHPGDPALKNCR